MEKNPYKVMDEKKGQEKNYITNAHRPVSVNKEIIVMHKKRLQQKTIINSTHIRSKNNCYCTNVILLFVLR